MAWHSINQAQKLTGKSRRTIYRDMASGRVSWRTNQAGHREVDTTELIRVYGDLSPVGTPSSHSVSHVNGTEKNDILLTEIKALRAEVMELKQMMLRIEFKPDVELNQPVDANKKRWWKIFGL
ncbi:entry exclusion protein 1 [Yersinia enterocolitica]|uniref:entry exclusion protein 1 n=1 Tax=Yersinia enterocolitica TaxID=630 RepID=UPI001CA4CEC0|nr:entry exclusion protein 1 [Yersinia enterocolitica]MBW5835903.1 entry exclusion protein 1 [Yersinia enterocolitica]HEN3672447.1 entry exclusion protein 1 [Yersinia enterocolitica]